MKRADIEAIRQSPRQWCDLPTIERLSDYAMQLEMQQDAIQAKIDAMMLEYCPDEMTSDQLKTWAANQRPVSDEEQASTQAIIDEALRPYRAALRLPRQGPLFQERTMPRTIDDLRAEVMRLTAELKDLTRSK